jgi:hypothetical protein
MQLASTKKAPGAFSSSRDAGLATAQVYPERAAQFGRPAQVSGRL